MNAQTEETRKQEVLTQGEPSVYDLATMADADNRLTIDQLKAL